MKAKIIFLLAFLACTLNSTAQRPKEKKDIVYLGETAQYKIEKSGGNLLKGISYLVTSLTNDTLIRFNFKSISVPGLPHENIGGFWSYYIVDFVGLGKSTEIDYTGKRDLIERLHQHGVIADNKVSDEGAAKFISAHAGIPKEHENIDSAIVHRKALLADKKYAEYSKSLTNRTRYNETLSLSGPNVMMGTTKIGTWKMGTNSNYGTMYHILRLNGKQAATIFFEKGKLRTYTRTDLDGKGREAFLKADFTFADLTREIQWLTNNGYY